MDTQQLLLITITTITILSILPEGADKARNVLAGAGLVLGVMISYGAKTDIIYDELIKWDVLVLIIFLSVFVDMLDDLGYFEYIGIILVKRTKGNQMKLFIALGMMMFFMSAFLDNVTAIILLSSLTITVCRRLEISPIPYLIYQTFVTGVGALLTPVGSVPNIIINSAIIETGGNITFAKWMAVMSVFAFISLGITTFYFSKLYSKNLNIILSEEKKDELTYLDANQVIRRKRDVYLASSLILLLVFLFIIAEYIHVGIEIMAAAVAILTMIVTGTQSREVWAKVDWNTLFFFSGLFIVVGSLDYADVLNPVSELISDGMVDNPTLLLLLFILVGGIASTGLNNIPVSLLFTSIL
ncbi:MAG: SLC13 family permease, partial [Candidatus Kariarchaeaceae archaeon]